MLHGDTTKSRLMVYAQSIKHSKHGKRRRDSKRGRIDEYVQPMCKKRAPMQYGSCSPKTNYERDGSSQSVNPTCPTCGKCLVSTGGCLGCVKDDHKGSDCPTIGTRGKETKQLLLISRCWCSKEESLLCSQN